MKLKALKLNKLTNDELNARRMNALKGGVNYCFCASTACSSNYNEAAMESYQDAAIEYGVALYS